MSVFYFLQRYKAWNCRAIPIFRDFASSKTWGTSRFGTSETLTCSHKNFASNGYSCFFKSIVCHKNKVILHSTSSSGLLAGLFEPDERHRLPHRRQMLPRRYEAVELCRTSLFFAARTLGTAVTGSADNDTPCHKLPRLCQPIVWCVMPIYFASKIEYQH